MYNLIQTLVIGPLAIAAMSVTLTKGKIFRTQRLWLRKRSSFLGGLFSCPYCTSHWLVGYFLWQYRPELMGGSGLADFLVSGFALVGISALVMGIIMQLIEFSNDPSPEEVSLIEKLRNACKQLEQTNRELKTNITQLENEVKRLNPEDLPF